MRQPDLSNANVVVVVFVMEGCGACKEYLPRFKKLAEPYRKAGLPILIYDAASKDERVQNFADRVGVDATPTTAILKRGPGVLKAEGSIPDEEIQQILGIAYLHAGGK